MQSGIENGSEDKDRSIATDTGSYGILLPLDIFTNGASGLESISKYLKDIQGLRYCEIASLINRDSRTIWGACKSANEKSPDAICGDSSIKVPISIFEDRSLSVLEALAEYLKEILNLRYCKIASLLNKDQRTIWTVYKRAKKKRKLNELAN